MQAARLPTTPTTCQTAPSARSPAAQRTALGNHANNSSTPGHSLDDEQVRQRHRTARRELVNWLRPLTTLGRVAQCGWTPRGGAVALRGSAEGGPAGWSGVKRCGSVWCCAECAPKIGAERAVEIGQCIRYAVDERGGSVLHATFTTSHHGGHTLVESWNAVQGAWQHVTKGRPWRRIGRRYGVSGYTRAFETTWGERNGWHPHLHTLVYLDQRVSAETAQAICDELYAVYLAGLDKRGFTATEAHGVRVDLATTRRDAAQLLGRYLTKIANELTRTDRKTASGPRFTPFDLLREAKATGNADLLDRWIEWEQASAGRKQLTWGGEIRQLARLDAERSDEEIAEDEHGDTDELLLPNDSWAQVREHSTELLDLRERDGLAAVVDWLDARRVPWDWPPAGPPEHWRPDPAATRHLHARDARRVLHRPRWWPDSGRWVIGALGST